MNAIKTWLAAHSITSKTVTAAWLFVTGMYYSQPAFHDFVTNAYATLPKPAHAVIAGIVIPALIFWKAEKGGVTSTQTTTTTVVTPPPTQAKS